jgi:hypothetical protein
LQAGESRASRLGNLLQADGSSHASRAANEPPAAAYLEWESRAAAYTEKKKKNIAKL